MKLTSLFIFISLFVYALPSPGQQQDIQKTREYLLQQEQRRKAELLRHMDSAVHLTETGEYEAADEKYRYVLQNIRSVPSELTFHFGKNSFLLAKYRQSIDWLNKYIQLKGTTGQYYDEAVRLLKDAEAAYLEERSASAQSAEQVLSSQYDIDCGPSGKVTCPVCHGNHVIIRQGPFGESFKTCPYCDQHGLLTCAQYNKLLRGELEPVNR